MDIIISHLPYIGYSVFHMAEVPLRYGVEIFAEYGDDYYWKYQLKKIMDGRTGKLSIHGPFCEINLAAEDCAFEEVKESFKRAFNMVCRYHAMHCVLHPHGVIPYPGFDLKEGCKGRWSGRWYWMRWPGTRAWSFWLRTCRLQTS